ncbi:MAG: hypothetical protein HDR89_09090 [Bacteroides sp.]|nr:hypothetical protein [Bacteroides sp.]
MKRLLIYLLPLLALSVGSCRSSEPFDNITRAATPQAFNYVTAAGGARVASSVCDDVSYYIVFDDENRTANITISNLRTPANDQPMTLTFMDCDMSYTSNNHSKERIVKADVLVSNAPAGSGEGVAITDATFIYTESNDLDPNGIDGIYARFTIDGTYTVTAYPYHVFADGTTRIDNLTSGTTAIDYDPVYTLDLDPDAMTATLKVYGLDLGIGEDIGAMTISRLKLTLTDGGYGLASDASTVMTLSQYSGDPHQQITLESLTATAELRDELRITMHLTAGDTSFTIAAFLGSNLSK